VGIHRCGTPLALSITSVPEIDPSGRFLGTTAFLRDTSLRDRAERELAESSLALEKANQRAALAIHSGGIGIWDWDIDAGTMLWDDQMYRLYGMAPREDFGDIKEWIRHVHPDDRSSVARSRVAAIETGAAFEIDFRVVWADGGVHHIRGSGQVAHDEAGRAVRMVGSNWDITERKVAEISLERERTQLRTLLRTIPDMVSLKDREGVYLACNVTFETFFGAGTDEIVGKFDHDFMPAALAASFRQTDIVAMENSGTRIDEASVTSPMDGRRLILEVRKTPMRDHQGTLLGVLSLSRDITVRRQAEEELDQHRHHLQELVVERTGALERANEAAAAAHRTSIERMNAEREVKIRSSKLEAVGTLAAGIAHDFNNILASIVGHAELADDQLPIGSEAKDSVAKIIIGSFRARDLVARMLDFARARPFEPMPIDVVLQVREAIALLRPSLPPSIEIDFQNGMRAATAMILADPTRIMQVVMNLCINAAHAMENRGVIAVSLDRAGSIEGTPTEYAGGVCLTVADCGSGMTPEVLERIFDPFFTTKQPGEGSGLGLSVVYGIVKDLGGLLNVVSSTQPKECGTRFRVFLPEAS
jgi:PAS domain S-box-containing protein